MPDGGCPVSSATGPSAAPGPPVLAACGPSWAARGFGETREPPCRLRACAAPAAGRASASEAALLPAPWRFCGVHCPGLTAAETVPDAGRARGGPEMSVSGDMVAKGALLAPHAVTRACLTVERATWESHVRICQPAGPVTASWACPHRGPACPGSARVPARPRPPTCDHLSGNDVLIRMSRQRSCDSSETSMACCFCLIAFGASLAQGSPVVGRVRCRPPHYPDGPLCWAPDANLM